MNYDIKALDAIGDPTRRRILELLRGGPLSVNHLVSSLPISQPAVSQHLKVLKDAGVVSVEARGTRRLYSIDPAGLVPVRAWLESFWGDALLSFAGEAERIHTRRKSEEEQ